MSNKKIFLLTLSLFIFLLSVCGSSSYVYAANTDFVQQAFPAFDPSSNIPLQQNATINTPSASYSSCMGVPNNIGELFDYGICILQGGVTAFLIGLGVIFFLVGVVGYITAGDNEEKREGGRNLMIFGIVVLFVMVSVWGLVNILSQSFFGHGSVLPTLPPAGSN